MQLMAQSIVTIAILSKQILINGLKQTVKDC